MSASYKHFTARKTANGIETDGISSALFGYKIPSGSKKNTQGVFAEWNWDGNRLTIRNDYSGYYPIFYYADSNQVMVSDSIIKLISLGAPASYNKDALSVFCRCGFFIADHTPFQEIHALAPNASFEWQNGRLSINAGITITKPQNLSKKEAVDGYIGLFRKAMERYQPLSDEFALPLSGGHDSRQILFELAHQGRPPKICVTCGSEQDITIAGMLAERLNLKHYILLLQQPWTEYIWRKNIVTHLCALEHTWIMGLGDYLTANFKECFEGTGVGIFTRSELFTPKLIKLYEAGRFNDIAGWIFNTVGPPDIFFNFLPERLQFIAEGKDIAVTLVAQELQRHSEAANPLTSFNFWNWNRRATALGPFGIQSKVKKINTPFLDRDLFDFVSSFTPELILEQEPQRSAIKKAYSKYADIPFYNELPQRKPNKNSFLSRFRNTYDGVSLITQYCPTNLPAMWKTYLLEKQNSIPNRKKSMQRNVLFYLSQLSYCSSKEKAKRMLYKNDKYERINLKQNQFHNSK